MIEVPTGTLSFQLCRGRLDLCFPPPTPTPEPTILSHPAIPRHIVSPIAASKIKVLDGGGRPHMRSIGSSDLTAPRSASLGGVSTRVREVVDTTVAFYDSFSLPFPSLLPIHLR